MAGNPENVHIWASADVYIFNPATAFVTATHIPGDIEDPLHAAWLPAGLMVADPGVDVAREIEKTPHHSFQLDNFITQYKNALTSINFTLFEDNEVTEDLISPEDVPAPKARYLALVFEDTRTGFIERRFTKRKADLWVTSDSRTKGPDNFPVEATLYPDSNRKIFTIQKGVVA